MRGVLGGALRAEEEANLGRAVNGSGRNHICHIPGRTGTLLPQCHLRKMTKKELIRTIAIFLNADEDLGFLLKLSKEDLTVLTTVYIREIVDRAMTEIATAILAGGESTKSHNQTQATSPSLRLRIKKP